MCLTLISLKAYGDFVIASGALKRVHPRPNLDLPRIVAGEHLRPLALALQIDEAISFIGDASWKDTPPIFDVRKRGVLEALQSFFEISHHLKTINFESNFVFDSLGWRERLISLGSRRCSLPEGCGNIYIAYDNFFRQHGFEVEDIRINKRNIRRAVIVPGARHSHKIIPRDVISYFVTELGKRNIDVDVLDLTGETLEIPLGVNKVTIPRRFGDLVSEIKKNDLVISSDSLSGHLSEYLQIPVFVSTSSPNQYWLPKSAYFSNGCATFSRPQAFQGWLETNFYL